MLLCFALFEWLLPEEAVEGPVLVPEFAGAVGVFLEEDTYAAVLEQGDGGIDRGAVEEQHGVLPGGTFVIADEDAYIAALHRIGYAVQEYVAAVAAVGGCNAQHVAVAGIGLHAFPTALGAPGLAAVGGVVVAACSALSHADEYASVGEFHEFGFVAAAVGAVGHLPGVAVVVAIDYEVIQRVVGLAAHGGGKHDATGMFSASKAQAVARPEE